MDAWLTLERQVLAVLILLLASATALGHWRGRSATLVAGAAAGAAFFVWMFGVRMIVPTEVTWALRLDWQYHFLGWHLFRNEPWHWPPGRIDSYVVPLGTTIGFTDAIPLAALLLKPFAAVLPMPFQYLGAWVLACFALQGYFAVLLASLWTSNALVQVAIAGVFVLVPTLLSRVGHPSLCSHWLLLWAIWLYFLADRDARIPPWQVAALGLASGLVHPYLAVMVLAVVGAVALRLTLHAWHGGAPRAIVAGVRVAGLAGVATLGGWWASGLFTVSGVSNLASEGLGKYSMNVLAVITPTGWSRILPEWPLGAEGQTYEGFQYLGAGLLLLLVLALVVRAAEPSRPRLARMWPLVAVCAALAVYALSPRVTVGSYVLADAHIEWLERASLFRATGRFFWPAGYLMLACAAATLIARVPPRGLVPLLAAVLAIQAADVHGHYESMRKVRLDPAWHEWPEALTAPAWQAALPHYDHIVMLPPPQCGRPPASVAALAYLAGVHGLSINGGLVARFDDRARRAACDALEASREAGEVRPDTVYVTSIDALPAFRASAARPVVCGPVDGVGVCVEAGSYAAWRDAASLD